MGCLVCICGLMWSVWALGGFTTGLVVRVSRFGVGLEFLGGFAGLVFLDFEDLAFHLLVWRCVGFILCLLAFATLSGFVVGII